MKTKTQSTFKKVLAILVAATMVMSVGMIPAKAATADAAYKEEAIAQITYNEADYDGLALNTINTIVKVAESNINASTDTDAIDGYVSKALDDIDAVLTKAEVEARNSVAQDAWIASDATRYNDGASATVEVYKNGNNDFAALMKFPLDSTKKVKSATLRLVTERAKDTNRNIRVSNFDGVWDEKNIANGSNAATGVKNSYAYFQDLINAAKAGSEYVQVAINGVGTKAIFDSNTGAIADWTTEIDVTSLIAYGDEVANFLISKPNTGTNNTVFFTNNHASYANQTRYQAAVDKTVAAGYDASYLAPALIVEYYAEDEIAALDKVKNEAVEALTYDEEDYDGLGLNTLDKIVKEAIANINAAATDTEDKVDSYKEAALAAMDAVLTKVEVEARNSVPQDAWIANDKTRYNVGTEPSLEIRRSGSTDFAALLKFPVDGTKKVKSATLRLVTERVKDTNRSIKVSKFDSVWDEKNIANGSSVASDAKSSYAYFKEAIDESRASDNYVEAALNGIGTKAIFDDAASSIADWTTEIDVTSLIKSGDEVASFLLTKANETTNQTVIFSNDHANYANTTRYQAALDKVVAAGLDASYLAPALIIEYVESYNVVIKDEIASTEDTIQVKDGKAVKCVADSKVAWYIEDVVVAIGKEFVYIPQGDVTIVAKAVTGNEAPGAVITNDFADDKFTVIVGEGVNAFTIVLETETQYGTVAFDSTEYAGKQVEFTLGSDIVGVIGVSVKY